MVQLTDQFPVPMNEKITVEITAEHSLPLPMSRTNSYGNLVVGTTEEQALRLINLTLNGKITTPNIENAQYHVWFSCERNQLCFLGFF